VDSLGIRLVGNEWVVDSPENQMAQEGALGDLAFSAETSAGTL
jgi:hypothetical protein